MAEARRIRPSGEAARERTLAALRVDRRDLIRTSTAARALAGRKVARGPRANASHDEGDGSRRIVYLASDLGGFPIYESIAYPDKSLVIYENSAAEVPASFPDAQLELPRGVRFERFPPSAAK
jgi:hypothetical protein